MSMIHFTMAAGLAWALATAPARAQEPAPSPLQAGIALYASAAYDEALNALDAARQLDLALDDRVALDQHRMLCLLALGRTAAADDAAARLLEAKPEFTLSAGDVSPRVRTMFDQARRRVLPGVVRRVYTEAKRAYDAGDFARARDGFTRLSDLLTDTHVVAADPAFTDLGTLSAGFRQLSAAALERQSAKDVRPVPAATLHTASRMPSALPASAAMHAPAEAAAPAPSPAVAPELPPAAPVTTAAAAAVVSPPFTPLGIFTYDGRDKDVVPPVPISQDISGWWGARGEPSAGTPLGAVDLVVDESGAVVDVNIHQSVSRFYDTVLLMSAQRWRFRPATKDGRPVKYRRITNIVSGR